MIQLDNCLFYENNSLFVLTHNNCPRTAGNANRDLIIYSVIDAIWFCSWCELVIDNNTINKAQFISSNRLFKKIKEENTIATYIDDFSQETVVHLFINVSATAEYEAAAEPYTKAKENNDLQGMINGNRALQNWLKTYKQQNGLK